MKDLYDIESVKRFLQQSAAQSVPGTGISKLYFKTDGKLYYISAAGVETLVISSGSGGTIDSTIIGSTTPAAGTFTDLAGNVPIITQGATGNVTAAQMKGQTHVVTGAYTLSLPTAVVGYRATFYASTAAVFGIDVVTGTDGIILNGTALTAGYKAVSDGTINAECYVECRVTGKYTLTAVQGIFVDGGA